MQTASSVIDIEEVLLANIESCLIIFCNLLNNNSLASLFS